MNVSEETALIAFKAICNFINDLESEFGKRHKPLKLYKRLINHTQISHDAAIRKHLTIFYDFSMVNRDALTAQDPSKLVQTKLAYSERVFIDMEFVFRNADSETTKVIWNHILTISAIVDPASKAKEILKKNNNAESDFLNKIITKVEGSVKSDANPMEALTSIMSSGLINDLVKDLQSEKLDMSKLLGVVQGMVTKMSSDGPGSGNDDAKNMMSMVTNMMGSLSNNGGPPDMMSMMSSFMNMTTNNPIRVEDVSDEKK
jgi:hypothetical protein